MHRVHQNRKFLFSFKRELIKYDKLIRNVQTDEVALDEKIAKRVEEHDRYQRRLDMLKSVRYVKLSRSIDQIGNSFVLDHRI